MGPSIWNKLNSDLKFLKISFEKFAGLEYDFNDNFYHYYYH